MKNIDEMIEKAADERYKPYYFISNSCFKAGANLLKPEIERLQKENDELRIQLEIESEFIYCKACCSCGESGCCSPTSCLYPDIKKQFLLDLQDEIKISDIENSFNVIFLIIIF